MGSACRFASFKCIRKHFVAEEAGCLFLLVLVFFQSCNFHKERQIGGMYEVRKPQDIKIPSAECKHYGQLQQYPFIHSNTEFADGILFTTKLNFNKIWPKINYSQLHNCICLACIFVILCVFVLTYIYLLYLMCICCTMCVLLFVIQMPDCWLEVSIRKVLRPATSTQVFLGFPVSTSECLDGSQFDL